jgi:peptidoglycan hydrolase CwlO-like protein
VGIRLDGSSSLCTGSPGAITSNLASSTLTTGKDFCMSDALIVGIFSGLVSLIGIFLTSKATRDEVTHKMDINQQVMKTEINHIKNDMEEMRTDIRSHNHYAKLFNENIPVIKEKLSNSNNRLESIENDIRFYHRRPEE